MRLVDTLEEQALLEALLEESKPAVPRACAHLHHLLSTPFRYPPSRHGSRFRRPFAPYGCFYAAEHVETAAIETGFWQLLFLADAPGLPWPRHALERRAFAAEVATDHALDLTAPPLDERRATWTHPTDYAPCQDFAEEAREAGIMALRSESVRDPARRANIALLDCAGFAAPEPQALQSWWIFPRPHALQAWCEAPRIRIEIPLSHFAGDPRIAARLS
ncbi:MAG: RES family NAD+ phosphorylase [Roseococcus sp.]|nr:RES family NAD+ phosphorylase [Roseococcus sp.]